MEHLLSREIFSKVQMVVQGIIQEKRCLTVTGQEFYNRLLSEFGFFTGLLIRPHQEIIVTTFGSRIKFLREEGLLPQLCANSNEIISLFLRDQSELKKSWEIYLSTSKSGGGRRKTRTRNNKKTKKMKRMKYK